MAKKEKRIQSFVGSLVNIPDTPFALGSKSIHCDLEENNMIFRLQVYKNSKEVRIRMNPVIAIIAGVEPIDLLQLELISGDRGNVVCELKKVDKNDKGNKYSPYVAIKSGYFCVDILNLYRDFDNILAQNLWFSARLLIITYERIKFYL